jgi:hypothetical protein
LKPVIETFTVVGGQTIYYKWDKMGAKPNIVTSIPDNIQILGAGSLFDKADWISHTAKQTELKKPKFDIYDQQIIGDIINFKIRIYDFGSISSFAVNGQNRGDLVVKDSFEVVEKLVFGSNSFEFTVLNKAGLAASSRIVVQRLTEKEKKLEAAKIKNEALKIEREKTKLKLEQDNLAKLGDNSPADLLCKKYGLIPQTSAYSECRMRIDFAQAESKKQQEQFEREQQEYERRQAAIERDRERKRNAALMELGLRMMGGQRPVEALNSLGTGAPIAPSPPKPVNQTIILPGGRMINCTTMGTMTNCF